MKSLTAVVLGATGFIGEYVVQNLLNDPTFSKVRILVRRPVAISHPRLEVEIVDFDNLVDYRRKLGTGDCIFCCVGTTNKKVKGDKTAYRKIDHDIPINAALMGKDAGFTHYLLVSAVGANATSGNFYLRLKGEVEKEIAAVNFDSFHAFRPSILLGNRKESRLGESVGKVIMGALSPVFAGGIEKYRGIEGEDVAKAMVACAKSEKKGMFVHHYRDMIDHAKSANH